MTYYDSVVDVFVDPEQSPARGPENIRYYDIGSSSLTVRFGDITESSAEVIVSSDDYLLSAGGGVSAAIARAGGHAVRIDSLKFESLAWGDVAVTTAGALPAKYVFHVVTIGPRTLTGDDTSGSADHGTIITNAVRQCLALARTLNVRSIAFPALGTGVADLDRSAVAAAMADAIATDLKAHSDAMAVEIHLVPKRWQSSEDYIVFFEEFAATVRTSIQQAAAPIDVLPSRSDSPLASIAEQIAEVEAAPATNSTSARLDELHDAFDEVDRQERPVQVFVSYAREDEEAARVLLSHLSTLRHQRLAVWSDQRIEPGEKWDEKIREAIETADIGIYLVSHWFLSSEYCVGVEWKRALERQEEGTMRMLPVILSQCHWTSLVGHIQVLPPGGAPLSKQPDQDEAFYDIVAEVVRLAGEIKQMRAAHTTEAD